MNDSIGSVDSIEGRQLETLSFSRAVPSGLIDIVHSLRDKMISRPAVEAERLLLPPVTRSDDDLDRSSKRAHVVSLPALSKSLTPEMTLEELTRQGFVELANKLKSKSGPPWDDILKFHNPFLIEQLYDLASLLKVKFGDLNWKDGELCMRYGIEIAARSTQSPSPLLGKYIHLIDLAPETTLESISSAVDYRWIEEDFNQRIDATKRKLAQFKRHHRQAKLQNEQIAYRNQLPIELSHYLLSSSGNYNIGVVGPLIEAFIDSPHPSLHYEKHLLRTLKQLARSPSVRNKFSHIKCPNSAKAPANIVIRTSLDLPPSHELRDLDAARAALTSLLTMLRQGKDGSCFATPLAISLLNSHLEFCLNDFQQLLEKSKLTRSVDGVKTDFPFLLHIGDNHLSEKVRISRTGRLMLSSGKLISLSKIPGIVAVKTAMGIEKTKITQFLFTKGQDQQPFVDITVKELLQALVKQANTLEVNKHKPLSELYLHAVFAFQAQECNPLLQVWENSIACMAEADEQSMVRSAILKSTHQVLTNFLRGTLGSDLEMWRQAAELFRKQLNEKIHLQWDPQIASDLGSDQKSSEGAFVLYDKGSYDKPSRWLRLDTPKAYQSFILRTTDEVRRVMRDCFDDRHWKAIQPKLISLEEYVESDKFLLDSLTDYYSPNGEIPRILQKLEHLAYTPWITKSGNNLNKVLQIYFERPELKASTRISPKNGEELLLKLIEMMRTSDRSYIDQIDSMNTRRSPVRIPYVHAFTFLPAHETFYSLWSSDMEPKDFIKHTSVLKGLEVASSPLPSVSKHQVVKQVADTLVPLADRSAFIDRMHQAPETLPMMEFRQLLIADLRKQNQQITLPLHVIEGQIDHLIYSTLPERLMRKLHASAIHIADSNWAEGVHAVHFSLIVNPGTGRLVLWGITDDSSHLIPLNQSVWFENNWWEFFNI